MPSKDILDPKDLLATIPTLPTPDDHVARLEVELRNLNRQLRALLRAQAIAAKDCAWYKAHYAWIMKKHDSYTKHLQSQREELYCMLSNQVTPCPWPLAVCRR